MRRFVFFLTFFLLAESLSGLQAAETPLWEAGFGAAGLSLPDYRGSNEQRIYVLPFPYLVYRGTFLRLDRQGLSGILFHSDRFQLNISADAWVPVKSAKNEARIGMPDLDPTLQLGPSLHICISRNCSNGTVAEIRLPLRAVFASDFTYLNSIGFVVNPQFYFTFRNADATGWNCGVSAGPLYASKEYHQYYYGVSPAYAEPGVRPAYEARSGYSGFLTLFTASRRFAHIWFGVFARYDDLSKSVFADSPLVKSKHSFMTGFGFAWVFGQSEKMVPSHY